MGLSFAQLISPRPADGWRADLLLALQGLGIVTPGGLGGGSTALGTGSISLSGAPSGSSSVIIQILGTGEQGTATYQYSLNAGSTYTGPVTVPASPGAIALGSTGVTVTFNSGPVGAGTSFVAGDTFTFELAVSPLSVTAWQSGSALRTIVEIEAQSLSDLDALIAGIAAGGLTATSTGAWLDLLASNVYQLTRNQATFAFGVVQLVVASGSGPYTVPTGGMWFADVAGHRFTNTAQITLTAGPQTLGGIPVQAEFPGSAFDVGNGAIGIIQAGTLPGVTVSNPDPGPGTWITAAGADIEQDSILVSRCIARWPAIGQAAGTSLVYDLWAKNSEQAAGHGTTITRTLIRADTVVGGLVNVYLATSVGPVGAQAVSDATAYILARMALVSNANIAAATAVTMTVAGAVNFFSSKTTVSKVQAAVQNSLTAYINALSLGFDAAGTVKVYWSEIMAAAGSMFGVRDVMLTLNGASTDVPLTLGQVATLTLGAVNYNPVTA